MRYLVLILLLINCHPVSHIVVGSKREPTSPTDVKVYLDYPESYEKIALVDAGSNFSFKDPVILFAWQSKMNKALETMVESSIDIHTEVLRNEDIIGEVFLNLKIWNKSPFPIMGHGDLEFRFDVVNANKSENYVDSAFYSIALRDDRISSERSNKGCTRFSIDNVSLMPRQFKIFKFMFCRCQPQSTITNRSLQSFFPRETPNVVSSITDKFKREYIGTDLG